ncbi:hypothetical protein [Halorhodospira halochloris]|uniref:hypothetical protein n=1 Tax=Halorhodospira halochloris TaxID=1052 RepID=UPI001EE844DA|nr:hypothetical protein [Halorhodospira halochloris]MCG5549282.1 hypothetical protein [Halorhodospira halochloris]
MQIHILMVALVGGAMVTAGMGKAVADGDPPMPRVNLEHKANVKFHIPESGLGPQGKFIYDHALGEGFAPRDPDLFGMINRENGNYSILDEQGEVMTELKVDRRCAGDGVFAFRTELEGFYLLTHASTNIRATHKERFSFYDRSRDKNFKIDDVLDIDVEDRDYSGYLCDVKDFTDDGKKDYVFYVNVDQDLSEDKEENHFLSLVSLQEDADGNVIPQQIAHSEVNAPCHMMRHIPNRLHVRGNISPSDFAHALVDRWDEEEGGFDVHSAYDYGDDQPIVGYDQDYSFLYLKHWAEEIDGEWREDAPNQETWKEWEKEVEQRWGQWFQDKMLYMVPAFHSYERAAEESQFSDWRRHGYDPGKYGDNRPAVYPPDIRDYKSAMVFPVPFNTMSLDLSSRDRQLLENMVDVDDEMEFHCTGGALADDVILCEDAGTGGGEFDPESVDARILWGYHIDYEFYGSYIPVGVSMFPISHRGHDYTLAFAGNQVVVFKGQAERETIPDSDHRPGGTDEGFQIYDPSDLRDMTYLGTQELDPVSDDLRGARVHGSWLIVDQGDPDDHGGLGADIYRIHLDDPEDEEIERREF